MWKRRAYHDGSLQLFLCLFQPAHPNDVKAPRLNILLINGAKIRKRLDDQYELKERKEREEREEREGREER